MEIEVKELLERVQQGDEDAFNEVYARYYKNVYYRAYKICQNEADAKDITQEVFYEVHRSLHKMRDVEAFYAWMMVVVSSKCNTMFRKRKFAIQDGYEIENSDYFKENRTYMDPEKNFQNMSEKELLVSLIDSLKPKHAQILKYIYFHEMKQAEIAEVLHIPLGTVKTRSVKAKTELRTRIHAYEKEHHYKLQFHSDLMLPSIFFVLLYPEFIVSTLKSTTKSLLKFARAESMLAISATCVSAVLVGGGVNIYQEIKEASTPPPEQVLKKQNFKSMSYNEDAVENSREAYYVCVNFATQEETFQSYEQSDFDEIKPVYEALKQSNSIYYEDLQTSGWISLFEKYAY